MSFSTPKKYKKNWSRIAIVVRFFLLNRIVLFIKVLSFAAQPVYQGKTTSLAFKKQMFYFQKNKYSVYLLFLFLVLSTSSCLSDEKKEDSTNNKPNTKVEVLPIKDSTLTDNRDGQTYRIRRFDGLWWMIDNINIELGDSLYYKDVYIGRGSYYYDNDPKYGSKYGQLYDLPSALEACPNGWRLPSIREWEALNKKYANCTWDNNSATGNYRDKMPSFEPVGSGEGHIYHGILDKEINKDEERITYNYINKYVYYWSQPDKNKPYFFSINMERCEAKRSLFQGASTKRTMAQRKFYSCRCVQEAK